MPRGVAFSAGELARVRSKNQNPKAESHKAVLAKQDSAERSTQKHEALFERP